MIHLLRQPGVQSLDDALILGLTPRSPDEPSLEERIDIVSHQLFGITEADTVIPEPEVSCSEDIWQSTWDRRNAREALIPIEACEHPNTIAYYVTLGIDVANSLGQPARILKKLHRQIVLSELGVMGTRLGRSLAAWESQILQESKSFETTRSATPWQPYRRQR